MNLTNRIKNFIAYRPITSLLIAINTVFLIITLFTGGFSIDNLVSLGALFPPLIKHYHEYYRLITAMFLHVNFLHFLMNMIVLYEIGGHMEHLIGPKKYILVYLLSGIASSMTVAFIGADNVITVGASGALFGIMGGLLILTFIRSTWFSPRTISSIRKIMGINLVITFIIPSISVLGHIGGLVMGLILFFIIAPKRPYYAKSYEIKTVVNDDQNNYIN